MTAPARGMPDVDLSEGTIEKIKAEAIATAPKKETEMFDRPNLEIQVDPKNVKFAEDHKAQGGGDVEPPPPPVIEPKPVKKPKRKLTDKQLEALKRGRAKSLEVRREKQKNKIIEAGKNASASLPPPPTHTQSNPQVVQPQLIQQQAQIDYDKIINGVVSKFDKINTDRQSRESRVAQDIDAFESRIREEERAHVLGEIERMQKEDEQKKNSLIAHHHLSRPKPAQSVNPYLYAMEMGAQSRYNKRW